MTQDVAIRKELHEREIARLGGELKILDREWNRRYYLAFFIVLAIPAGIFFGKAWAVLFVLCTPALIATQTYLLAVRKADCRALIKEAEEELARLRSLG